ncbi:Uncharacterised protein [Mycobacteroides abscessus subsp. abscessus]|nr:Uncharacterised protein [Mycobacteroides abscessus subsp. abscessus]
MAVTLKCLCRNRSRLEAKFFAYIAFHKGVNIGVSSYSTGHLPEFNAGSGLLEALQVPLHFLIP